MYNHVGRTLLIVGRQFRQKLYDNASNSAAAIGCAARTAIHCTPKNDYLFSRSYCYEDTDESDVDVPKLITTDEEGSIKLKEFLSVPENVKIFKIIEMEFELMRQNNDKVPEVLKPRHWAELIQLDSRNKRKRYCIFLWGLERKKENVQKVKDEKRKAHEALIANGPVPQPFYSLGSNSMFLRFYDQTMNRALNGRVMNSMLWGQKIVMDCGYEENMTRRELKNCAKQLQLTFAANRMSKDPFNIHFCNTNLQGTLMKTLHRAIPTLYDSDYPVNVNSASYLDLFDKQKLIYLTPHCHTDLHEFDHEAVYIIGAFVDKSTQQPLSMAKAKKEGLKMAKFPLDRYLQWGTSSGKNLTLNQVIDILLDLRDTGSWDSALKFIPRRKLYAARYDAMERKEQKTTESSFYVDDCDETITPIQEIKPKVEYRYNADQDYKPRKNNQYRSSYQNSQRDSRSSYGERSGARMDQDFSMKSRSRFKNNWKN